jgi:Ca2+-binding RTX toxin-like protein
MMVNAGAQRAADEMLVNVTTAGQQSYSWNAGLAGGRHVVTWIDSSSGNATVRARLFDAAGAAVGGEITVNTSTQAVQWMLPVVTALTNGNFVVTWHDNAGTLGDTSLNAQKAQIFTADGVKVGSEFLVNSFTANAQEWGKVTALAGGGFVVAWEDTSGALTDKDDYGVVAQVFSASGAKLGGSFQVNTTTAGIQSYQSLTGLKNGGFVVTWHDNSGTMGDTSLNAVKAQVFTASGGKLGSEFIVNQETAGDQRNPMIASLDNGDFVITWRDGSGVGADTEPFAVKARIYSAAGVPRGGEFLVNSTTAGSQSLPTIAGLVGGGFVVTWQDVSQTLGDASSWSIKAQVYDNFGSRIGDEFLVNTTTNGTQISPAVSGTADGGFVVSWDDYGNNPGDTTGGAVRSQLFGRAGLTLDGTTKADRLIGSTLHDHLDGKAGADIMAGGRGDDTYYVDNVQDNVVEADGAGHDIIYSSVSYTLAGRAVEELILTGSAHINAIGNALDNVLVGNAGRNTLNGGAGADVMTGGAGNDIYYVDNVGDKVVEVLRGGTDQIFSTVSYSLMGTHVEKLALTGTADTDATGNGLANELIGNDGDNVLDGGASSDVLRGRGGVDLFKFSTRLGADNVDTIVDFSVADDTIWLDAAIFRAAPKGVLPAAYFHAGTAATTAQHRILYDAATGDLFYDADGNGAGAAVLFAHVTAGLALTQADFLVL